MTGHLLDPRKALLAPNSTRTQNHPPSFPGTSHTLYAEGRDLTNEGRVPDVGHAHVQATVNMNGSGSHIQPSSAASSTTPAIDRKEHMKSSMLLHPKTKNRTWPLLPVTCGQWSQEKYEFNFKKVVEYLKDAIDDHNTLRDIAGNIHYKLMMVGSSLESAKPSTLVICKCEYWDSLNSLLKTMPSEEYNCMIPSTWDRAHKLRFRDGGLSRMSNLRPILWLYLCPTSFETLRRLGGAHLSIECSSFVTMCGSLVEFEGRQSTISLTLDIDGEDRLLTVEHIFQDNEVENDKPQMSLDPESLASIESNIEQWDCFDESEDDISADLDTDLDSVFGGTQLGRILPTTSINYNPSQVSHEPTKARVETRSWVSHSHKQGERVEPPNTLPRRSPYLDWACLRLVNYQMAPKQRCNFLLRRGKPPGLLRGFTIKPRTHAVPVFMISGILGVRPGRLIESPNYLGSPKEQHLCETWTIILDQQEGFHPGESGSIVVDQETLKIYGHLVGSDMFGYGHVVPFLHTIKQIKTAFNAANVKLPTRTNSGSHQGSDMDNKDGEELALLLRGSMIDISKVQRLIERGADVNRPNTDGETPLSCAASQGHLIMVELLLRNGADLSVPNKYGETPLSRAASGGHQTIIELLLGHGADLSVPNKNGETPLSRAAAKGHYRIVELLREAGAEVNITDDALRVALLFTAVRRRYSDLLQQLLKAGAEVNVKDEYGQTPLLMATSFGDLDTVKQLLKAGAEVNVRDEYGRTPLFHATPGGDSDFLAQLIKAGAEVNLRDKDGFTPLMAAVESDDEISVQKLLSAGALLDSKDNQGRTALIIAIQRENAGLVRMLTEAGAAMDVKDN